MYQSGKRSNPRRGEILEATLRVIGESGVNGVTHRAVAQEADVALASTSTTSTRRTLSSKRRSSR
jgi:DNA-binding transcriptional regulator YbjK